LGALQAQHPTTHRHGYPCPHCPRTSSSTRGSGRRCSYPHSSRHRRTPNWPRPMPTMQTSLHSKLRQPRRWQPKAGIRSPSSLQRRNGSSKPARGLHADEFMTEQVYQDMDAEGGASEGSFGNGSAEPLQDQGTHTLCHRDLNLPVTVTRRANAKVRLTINFFVLTSKALPSLLVPFG
jgi:hypothetical protein